MPEEAEHGSLVTRKSEKRFIDWAGELEKMEKQSAVL